MHVFEQVLDKPNYVWDDRSRVNISSKFSSCDVRSIADRSRTLTFRHVARNFTACLSVAQRHVRGLSAKRHLTAVTQPACRPAFLSQNREILPPPSRRSGNAQFCQKAPGHLREAQCVAVRAFASVLRPPVLADMCFYLSASVLSSLLSITFNCVLIYLAYLAFRVVLSFDIW